MHIDRKSIEFSTRPASQEPELYNRKAEAEIENPQEHYVKDIQVKTRDCMPSSIPPLPLRQSSPESTPPVFLSSPTPIMPVKQETVNLENHVSLQIFSSALTQNNKNVIVFLHGGPGLAYDETYETYEPMTKWFVGHGYTLVAPEIAGSGKPGLEDTSNSHTRNYVRDLKSVVQCLSERSDMQGKEFCVVAHSWGGFQLASLLTDETAEERRFFKQAAFISPNLDSAQTRLFADASQYDESTDSRLATFERTLVRNFEERHAGQEQETGHAEKMTVVNNPLINQALNEKFSPFYRLDKMPRDIPCLFFHATNDLQVPVSQSVDAFARVNNAGGDARIVISSQGGHGFFKTGHAHNADVMTSCFGVIETLVKQSESSKKAVIDGDFLPDTNIAAVEEKILEVDKTYENYTKVLEDFHNEIEPPASGDQRKRIPPKRKLLRKIADAHVNIAEKHKTSNSLQASKNAETILQKALLINESLEKS